MKNITLLSLAAAAVLFSACGEDAKKAAAEATAKAAEMAKEATSSAVEATKEAAANTVDAAKAAAKEKAAAAAEALKERAAAATEAAKEKAAEAVDATKEAASSAAAAVAGSDDLAAKGKELYAKCAGCHGADGKTKALGKSAVIAGESAEDIEKKLQEYKAGTRNVAGMGMLMKGQVVSLSDEDIKALAAYIASLK